MSTEVEAKRAPYVIEWRDGFKIGVAQVDQEHRHLFTLVRALNLESVDQTVEELLDYVVNKEDFRITDGFMQPLTKPGLGVVVDEEKVIEASRNAPDWRNPVWRHADGSVAEW